MLKPANIRDRAVWQRIRPHLEYVRDIRGGDWHPEDIWAACSRGDAFLFMADEGFVVLKPMRDDFSGVRFLLVWLAYGEGGDCIDRYQDDLIEIARQAGYSRLQFWRRPRGEVQAKGWQKQYTIYELEIPE